MTDDPVSESNESTPPWSRRRQEVGAIVWSSFLAACLAAMIFFAIFDPVQLGNDDQPPAWLANRMAGYAIGFFFFWFVTMVAALLTAYLLDTLPPDNSKQNNDKNSSVARRVP
jgi:hypothetical protein